MSKLTDPSMAITSLWPCDAVSTGDVSGLHEAAKLRLSLHRPCVVHVPFTARAMQAGADAQLRDSSGATPMDVAASEGDEAMVKLLLPADSSSSAADLIARAAKGPRSASAAAEPAAQTEQVMQALYGKRMEAQGRFVKSDTVCQCQQFASPLNLIWMGGRLMQSSARHVRLDAEALHDRTCR